MGSVNRWGVCRLARGIDERAAVGDELEPLELGEDEGGEAHRPARLRLGLLVLRQQLEELTRELSLQRFAVK